MPIYENVDVERYDGELDEMREDNMDESSMVEVVERLIEDATSRNGRNSQRNAEIVRLYLGVDCDRMNIADIASMYGLTHESVRLVVRNAQADLRRHSELIYSHAA